MNNPNSKPVLNMKRTLDIQYVSMIKLLPSISLYKYREASHHPVCTLFRKSDTSFFTGHFSESLTYMWENNYETIFFTQLILVAMRSMRVALAQPQTLPMHSMSMDTGGVLFSFVALTNRLVASCLLLRMPLSGFFS